MKARPPTILILAVLVAAEAANGQTEGSSGGDATATKLEEEAPTNSDETQEPEDTTATSAKPEETEGAGKSCYSDEKDPYSLFATKTSYFEVANLDAAPVQVEGCRARAFWMLARHGARNPGGSAIRAARTVVADLHRNIIRNYQEGKGQLCQADVDSLEKNRFNLTEAQSSLLTPSGEKEQEGLGQRFSQRFPDLFGKRPFDPKKYKFRFTNRQRTRKSAEAFARGAFPEEEKEGRVVMTKPRERDPLLKFYEVCTKWVDEVDDSPSTYAQQRRFWRNSTEAAGAKGRIARRLGYKGYEGGKGGIIEDGTDDVLTDADFMALYGLCRFGRAHNPGEHSPWCAAFSREDLEVFEYYQDLDYYYKTSYGNSEITSKMPCPLIKDLVDTFDRDPSSRPLGTFLFSHSDTLVSFLTLLGLYRDRDPLTHENYPQMRDGRKFRTSLIDPFATNVAFALLDCQEEPRERVVAMHQEDRVSLPGCGGDVCSWEKFKELYKGHLNCDLSKICEMPQRDRKMRKTEPKPEASKSNKQARSEDGGGGGGGGGGSAGNSLGGQKGSLFLLVVLVINMIY